MLAGLTLMLAGPAHVETSDNPYYTTASIVNAATNQPQQFAPNAIVTIYGTSLSRETLAVDSSSIQAGALPIELGGVHVIIDGRSAGLYYISPTQINILVPNDLLPGDSKLVVVRNGLAGPSVAMPLSDVAPGFFTTPDSALLATHANGQLISSKAPAMPNEWVVLYCEGLGRTVPDLYDGEIAVRAQPIAMRSSFSVLVDGAPVPAQSIYYAGVAPGFAGLYQVNVKMPPSFAPDPEVRIAFGASMSPPATFLHASS